MSPAASGSPVSAPGAAAAPVAAGERLARAFDVLERELTFTQGDVDRVAAACAAMRADRGLWSAPDWVPRFRQLTALVTTGSNAARGPVLDLLHEVADAGGDPWSILSGLLQSHDAAICHGALDRLRRLSVSGTLASGVVINALARMVESGSPVLREATALEKIRELLRGPPSDRAPDNSVAITMYLDDAAPQASRRLAARVLDLSSSLPAHAIAVRLLGHELAEFLAPYLAFTRATHLDLLDVSSGLPANALLASLRAARASCGDPLFRDAIAALGWRWVNGGLRVERWLGVQVGNCFPLLATPGEAALLSGCEGVRTSFERLVILADALVRRGDSTLSAAGKIDRFRACNLRHADALGRFLDMAPLTAESAAGLLRSVDALVEDFVFLFGDGHRDECAEIEARYRTLAANIRAGVAGSRPEQPLASDLARQVQMFEDPASPSEIHTLHGCKRYLHQRGLRLGASLAETVNTTGRAVAILLAAPGEVLHTLRAIEYADFEASDDRPRMPPVVRAAVDGFVRQLLHGERSFPSLRLFCYGNEVHCFASFRNHPAFIRVDFSPPQRGGMIDLEYCGVSKYDLEWHPNVELDAIQEILRALDFDVGAANTRIHARYDKERAADLNDLKQKLHALFCLVPYLMDVDWAIADLEVSDAARHEVAVAWSQFFRDWGVLPLRHVLTADRRGILAGLEPTAAGLQERRWREVEPYRDLFTPQGSYADFWSSVERALRERGHEGAIVARDRPVTQELFESTVRGPLARMLAHPAERYVRCHEASVLAEIAGSDDRTLLRAERVARIVGRLAAGLRFDATGAVNGYEVVRASLPLPDGTIWFWALCDGSGIPRLALFSDSDALYADRRSGLEPPAPEWLLDAEALGARLRRANLPVEWLENDRDPADITADRLRALFHAPNAHAAAPLLPGERVLRGVKASPGRAVGLARMGVARRAPADLEGAILIAGALSPRDNPLVYRAAGIVSTAGGVLSHAGLLALQFAKPALVVRARWERSLSGADSLVYACAEQREIRTRAGGFEVMERHEMGRRDERVQDGDLVIVDADEGTFRVLGQEHDAIALFDNLRQLTTSSRALRGSAADHEVLAHRGRLLRARHQLERLLSRLRDPALARYAVCDLLIGAASADVRQEDRAGLLRMVLANERVAATASETLSSLHTAVGHRSAALATQAIRAIPLSRDPLEVLTLRLNAIGGADLFTSVSTVLVEAGLAGPVDRRREHADVDILAGAQLRMLHDDVLGAIQPPPARDEEFSRARHAVRQLDRLEQVIAVPAAARRLTASVGAAIADHDAAAVRRLSDRHILGPTEGGQEMWPLVGSKAANLAEMARLGQASRIPAWFAVTDRAFREVLELPIGARESGGESLAEFIQRTTARAELSDRQKSLAIAAAWEQVAIPARLDAELHAAYESLGAPEGEPGLDPAEDPRQPFVAVRSSAKEEDLETATRAGEFDTFLFVRGMDGLRRALRRAWSGLWTERAIHSRAVLGTAGAIGGGVLVQRMVWARASGVLHTVNLAEGRLREMVINAGLGLGEGVVSGAVAADMVIVSKEDSLAAARVRFRYIANDKRQRVVFDAAFGAGTRLVDVLPHQRLRPVLDYIEVAELAGVAASLEAAYRQPLDVEFAIEKDRLWLLQVRPIPSALVPWRQTIERRPLVRRQT